MYYDDISREVKQAVVEGFYSAPVDCMTFACRRLREIYPSVPDFVDKAPLALRVLMEYTFTSIDFSERSHSQMRRDLFSAGPAQGFLSAADRVLCRQFASAHVVL